MITGTNRSKTKHTTWEERRSRLRVQQPLRNSLHLLLQKNWSDSGKCLRSSRCWKPLSMTSCFDFMPKCKHQHSTRFNTMQLWFKTYNTFSHRNIEDSPILYGYVSKLVDGGNPSILGPHLETEPMHSTPIRLFHQVQGYDSPTAGLGASPPLVERGCSSTSTSSNIFCNLVY